jgi:hypothetical protein
MSATQLDLLAAASPISDYKSSPAPHQQNIQKGTGSSVGAPEEDATSGAGFYNQNFKQNCEILQI